jgi:hypothetical protein
MDGELVEHPPADFAAYLRNKVPHPKNVCSVVPEYSGNKKPEDYSNWSDAAEIDVTVVRCPLGVAEMGSVLLGNTTCASTPSAFLRTISSFCWTQKTSSRIFTMPTSTGLFESRVMWC